MTFAAARRSSLALALLAHFATAFADHAVHIDASSMPYRDAKDKTKSIIEVGVDLTCEGDLTLVFAAKGRGNLGNAIVPGYAVALVPKNALDKVELERMVTWNGTVQHVPDGMTLVVKKIDRNALRERTLAQLEATGCTVLDHQAGSNVVFFTHGGQTYRATFASVADGAQHYVGRCRRTRVARAGPHRGPARAVVAPRRVSPCARASRAAPPTAAARSGRRPAP